MKKIIKKKKPDIHRGFVSLEIMGALVVVALAALFGAEKYSDYLDEQEWVVAARHASQFNEASKQYIADHRDELLNKPLPYRITPSLLIKNGYLQQGFAEKNGLGQQYVTGVVKNSQKNPPALQALTCSVQGDTLPEKGMRRIAAQINGMGGYVDDKNIATGAYGGWTSQPRDFGLDCRHGHIAIALSSEILGSVLQESDRLYRFQVKHRPELNRMHTDIDMGSNSLNNANQINAENDITTRSGWLVTQDNKGWMNRTYGGGFYMSDEEWIRAVNNKGVYTGGELKGGTVRADGRLSAGEFLQLDEVMVESTACPKNGLVSRDDKGALLSCQSGVWTPPDRFGQYSIYSTRVNYSGELLGQHKFCALTAVGTTNDSSSCVLNVDTNNQWTLTHSPMSYMGGYCKVSAPCRTSCEIYGFVVGRKPTNHTTPFNSFIFN